MNHDKIKHVRAGYIVNHLTGYRIGGCVLNYAGRRIDNNCERNASDRVYDRVRDRVWNRVNEQVYDHVYSRLNAEYEKIQDQ